MSLLEYAIHPIPPSQELWQPSDPETWQPVDVEGLNKLEGVWPPWLRKPKEHIRTIAEKEQYAPYQLVYRDEQKNPVAALTSVRTEWHGDPRELAWDFLAGGSEEKSDYTNTFNPKGNAVVAMSTSILPAFRRRGLGKELLQRNVKLARESGATYFFAPIRAATLGERKIEKIMHKQPFSYVELWTRKRFNKDKNRKELADPWLRTAVEDIGLQFLWIIENSMVVTVPLAKLQEYRENYYPELWLATRHGYEISGQTGSWFIHKPGEKLPNIENTIIEVLPKRQEYDRFHGNGDMVATYTETNGICGTQFSG